MHALLYICVPARPRIFRRIAFTTDCTYICARGRESGRRISIRCRAAERARAARGRERERRISSPWCELSLYMYTHTHTFACICLFFSYTSIMGFFSFFMVCMHLSACLSREIEDERARGSVQNKRRRPRVDPFTRCGNVFLSRFVRQVRDRENVHNAHARKRRRYTLSPHRT